MLRNSLHLADYPFAEEIHTQYNTTATAWKTNVSIMSIGHIYSAPPASTYNSIPSKSTLD